MSRGPRDRDLPREGPSFHHPAGFVSAEDRLGRGKGEELPVQLGRPSMLWITPGDASPIHFFIPPGRRGPASPMISAFAGRPLVGGNKR